MIDGFDPAAGEFGKHEGMARAERGADPQWKIFMYSLAIELFRWMPTLTTDQLEKERSRRHGPTTPEKRALGPLMRELATQGVCQKLEDWVEATEASCHRRPKPI